MTGPNETPETGKTIGGRAVDIVESAGSHVEDVVEGVIGEDHLIVRKTKGAWQTFLLYPAVFGVLLGAIPTGINLYKSIKYDISYSDVAHAEKQVNLWKKNIRCVAGLNYHTVKTEDGATVQIGACQNGDVLIELIPGDGSTQIAEWVSLDRSRASSAVGSLLISKAFAAGDGAAAVIANGGKVQTMCSSLNTKTNTVDKIVKQNGKCTRVTTIIMERKTTREAVSCDAKCAPAK